MTDMSVWRKACCNQSSRAASILLSTKVDYLPNENVLVSGVMHYKRRVAVPKDIAVINL